MLADPSSKYDHTRLFRCAGKFVEKPDVFHDIDNQAGIAEGVEVDHIAQRAISEGGAEDWDIILCISLDSKNVGLVEAYFVCPVVHRVLIIDLLTKSSNDRTW